MKPWSLPLRYSVGILLVVLLGLFLWHIRSVLRPLIIAAFIAYLLNPPVGFLIRRKRFSRTAAVNLVFFTVVAVLVAFPATIMPIFFNEIQMVFNDVLDLFDELDVLLSRPVMIGGQRFYLDQMAEVVAHFRTTVISPLPAAVLKIVETTSLGALWALVILVSVYLFLSKWHTIREWLFSLFHPDYADEAHELYRRVCEIWLNYLRGTLLLMFIVFVVFTIAWMAIGIPGALVLGLLAGFLTIIPDVGPAAAVLIAIVVALLEGSNWIPLSNGWIALIVLGVYLVLINIKNLLIRPFIMGRSVHMNEGLVLVAILLATVLWGILGALLIVPVLASLAVVGDYLRRRVLGLAPFPDLLPGASTPEQSASESESLPQEVTSD